MRIKRGMLYILIAALLLSLIPAAVFADNSRTATVQELYGSVKVKMVTSEKEIKAFKGMRLNEGDTILTGKDSKAVLRLDQDKEIVIAANTQAVLTKIGSKGASTDTVITIVTGGVGNKVEKKLDKDSKYKIKTPTAVMGVRGTEFYVQVERDVKKGSKADPDVNVWLAEGTIELNFRLDGVNITNLNENIGKPKTIIMTAPSKFEFPSEGKVELQQKKFEIDGLYKEFLDQPILPQLGFDDDEIASAHAEAVAEEKEDEDDAAEEEERPPYWSDVEDGADDDHDEDDEDDVGDLTPPPGYVRILKVISYVPGTQYEHDYSDRLFPFVEDGNNIVFSVPYYDGSTFVTRPVRYPSGQAEEDHFIISELHVQ